MNILQKAYNGLFGKRELVKAERNRLGGVSYSFLDGEGFVNSDKYLDISLTNPVLMTVILLRARLYSQMEIKHVNSNGEEVKNSPYTKLLKQPNFFQSQEDFLFQQMWFLSATGNDLMYQIKAFTNDVPKALYNLIPSEIDFKKTQKINKFITTDKDKKAFGEQEIEYKLDNQTYKIKLSEIIPLYDIANGLECNSFFHSPSRVQGISKVLENIEQNLKSKNKNLQFSAKYIGMNKSTGNEGQILPDDKKAIEKVLSSKDVLTTNRNIEYKHLVSDMKRLFLDEQYAEDANKVLLAFEMNKNVLNYFSKDSTFENQSEGIISYIQNSVQTTAKNTMASLSAQWGLIEKGEILKASYDHLAVMQGVVNEKIKSFNEMQVAIKAGLENGTLSQDEAKKMSDAFKLKLEL
jgi:hypothetical protein